MERLLARPFLQPASKPHNKAPGRKPGAFYFALDEKRAACYTIFVTAAVKELLSELKRLDALERVEFFQALPKALGESWSARRFSDSEILRLAKLAKKGEGVLFDDLSSARRFLKTL